MSADTKFIETLIPANPKKVNVTSLAFKSESAWFVAADRSSSLRQWNADDGLEASLSTMKTRARISINVVVVSPDGRWIVSGGLGSNVAIWSIATQKEVIEIEEHTGPIRALDVSGDSSKFASGSIDNTVRIFDITSGTRLVPPLQHQNPVVGVKFSPDGYRVAAATHAFPSVSIYSTHAGEKLFEIPVTVRWTPVTPLAWSVDGQLLFIASPGIITRFDTSTSSHSEWPIHDDNKQVSIVTSRTFIVCSAGSSITFWDLSSQEQIGQIINHATAINCIAISHDARYLACGHNGGITVHNLERLLPSPHAHVPAATGATRLPCMPMPCELRIKILKSWTRGNPRETETILSDEIAKHSNPSYDLFATRAFMRVHLGEWEPALEDTKVSLQIRQSPIGQIARSTALVAAGEKEIALDELDLVFCNCDQSDIEFLLVVNSIFLFECNKHEQAIARLRRFISASDLKMNDVYLQVLGMMYLKQKDYENAVQTLDAVKNPFIVNFKERDTLMEIFMIFNWNFEGLKFIAWQRFCETLYASGSLSDVGENLVKMVSPLPEDEKEIAHGRILQEVITRSGEVILLGWTGKPSACNSCLPSSPEVYGQTQLTLPSLEAEHLEKRVVELRKTIPLTDALMTFGSIARSQPVRFTNFRLLLPCIVLRIKSLRRGQGNVYHAKVAGLEDVELTTADSLPLNESQKLVFVNPWIHHLLPRVGATRKDENGQRSDVEVNIHTKSGDSDSDVDADVELVHESMIEEAPQASLDMEVYTQALESIARIGQPFTALLLLKQPDGTYRRVAADHDIVVRGIRDDGLRDICIEVLEIL